MPELDEVKIAILEMRDLLRLLAAPAVAERDKKSRDDVQRIAGQSEKKQAAIMLMDGNRTQSDIFKESGINQGHLSTLVKQLGEAGLLADNSKKPKLKIFLPANFFEGSK